MNPLQNTSEDRQHQGTYCPNTIKKTYLFNHCLKGVSKVILSKAVLKQSKESKYLIELRIKFQNG